MALALAATLGAYIYQHLLWLEGEFHCPNTTRQRHMDFFLLIIVAFFAQKNSITDMACLYQLSYVRILSRHTSNAPGNSW